MLTHRFPLGRELVAHFNVLERTNESILWRCGDFPWVAPDGPRGDDSLIRLSAILEPETHQATFIFDSVIFQGKTREHVPFLVKISVVPFMAWAHRQYTKLLVETAIPNVTRLSST